MQTQFLFMLLPLLMAAAISGTLAVSAWKRQPSAVTRSFALLLAAIALWAFCYAFEVAGANYQTKLFWSSLQYLGIVILPPTWLIFSLAYSGRNNWLNWHSYTLLAIEPIIILLLVWTNEFHNLIWVKNQFVSWHLPLDYIYGAGFWFHAAYTYSLLLFGSVILVQSVVRSSQVQRGQVIALLIGLLAPWLANLIYLADLNPLPTLDLTPFAFTITGLAVGWGLLRHNLLDIIPIARNAVIESMSAGVIVIDPQDRIIDLNPTALQAVDQNRSNYIGKPLEQVFPFWHDQIDQYRGVEDLHTEVMIKDGAEQRHFDLRITPLRSRVGEFSGRVLTVSDITDRVHDKEALEVSERGYHSLYTSMNEGMALSELVYAEDGEIIDYTILEVNPAYEKIIGLSRAEAMGCRASILYGTGNPPYLDIYAQVALTGKPTTFETTFDPLKKSFSISVFSPRPGQFATVFSDISERKDAEERLALQAKIVQVTAKLTADFNTATSSEEVLQALWRGLQDLGYKYLSPWDRQGERLVWNKTALDMPDWLLQDIPEVLTRFVEERDLIFWVPINTDNIYERCYHSQKLITTEDDLDILNPIHLGEKAFQDLPAWVKRAALQMMKRLDVGKHRAFPFGKYGIVFLSNPRLFNDAEQIEWVEIILKQAEIAMARTRSADALLESENRYRALFERTNDAVFILDLDLAYISVNQQAADMLGYDIDELIGMYAKQVVAPEEWQDLNSKVTMLRDGEIPPIYQRTLVKKDGSRILAELSVAMAYDRHGEPSHFQNIVRDVTEQAKARDLLEHLATHDSITNLPNRILFNDRINHAITQANRKKCKIAVLFFDLDNFKMVNDEFGHNAGDLLLLAVGKRLLTCVRESDSVARLGGDEFTILLENINERNDVERVVNQLLISFSKPFSIQEAEVKITFSIGISLYPDDAQTVEELLKKSDQAMYTVKHSGKNGYSFFSP